MRPRTRRLIVPAVLGVIVIGGPIMVACKTDAGGGPPPRADAALADATDASADAPDARELDAGRDPREDAAGRDAEVADAEIVDGPPVDTPT